MFAFEELTEETRQVMLQECESEQSQEVHYMSPRLSAEGSRVYPDLMREAIVLGNEESLEQALLRPEYWVQTEMYQRSGRYQERRVNFQTAAKTFAITEFNTWYVRGLARLLLNEGIETCEVYRAEAVQEPRGECLQHEGVLYRIQDIYDGHRARYWPLPGIPNALSIPVGPNCHHTIRRVRNP